MKFIQIVYVYDCGMQFTLFPLNELLFIEYDLEQEAIRLKFSNMEFDAFSTLDWGEFIDFLGGPQVSFRIKIYEEEELNQSKEVYEDY